MAFAKEFGVGFAVGAALGVFVGFVWSFDKTETSNAMRLDRQKLLPLVLLIVAVSGLALLLWPRARDEGHFETYEQIKVGEKVLAIGLGSPPLMGRFGFVRVHDGKDTQAVVLDREEWDGFLGLINRAELAQSESWQEIGWRSDGSGPPTRIEISAGLGIALRLSSADGRPVVFVLPPADFPRFDSATNRVSENLRR